MMIGRCFEELKTQKLKFKTWAVVVAKLEERLLQIPKGHGSNPLIRKFLFILNICLQSTVY